MQINHCENPPKEKTLWAKYLHPTTKNPEISETILPTPKGKKGKNKIIIGHNNRRWGNKIKYAKAIR